jgi:hypothetical protein
MQDTSDSTGSKTFLWIIAAIIGTSILASIIFRAVWGNSNMKSGTSIVTDRALSEDELLEIERAAPATKRISLDEFESIDSGMTMEDVRKIVGSKGSELNEWEDDSSSGISWYWSGEESSSAYATIGFLNGKVSHKVNMGLK